MILIGTGVILKFDWCYVKMDGVTSKWTVLHIYMPIDLEGFMNGYGIFNGINLV